MPKPVPMSGNLLAGLPRAGPEEQTRELFSSPAVRIERIVSTGQASPPGFWYDQDWDEWVLLVSGEAVLRIETEPAPRTLQAGDYVLLPAHCRHRVEWTTPGKPAIWLAVHCR
jgi:cupin 2 domain-containing protein